jgi:hypothetical protein
LHYVLYTSLPITALKVSGFLQAKHHASHPSSSQEKRFTSFDVAYWSKLIGRMIGDVL